MKAAASIIFLIVFLILNTPLAAARLGQVADTIPDEENIYLSGDDSLNVRPVLNGQALINDTGQVMKIVEDSYATGMLDSLSRIPYFKDYYLYSDSSMKRIYDFQSSTIPVFPDSVYARRIENLDRETTVGLTYNQAVKSYIELYAVKKRVLTSKILGLQEIYFPLFEEYLDKYDIPLEMKYLAVVESALNPTAGSRAGAKGLWQFMYYTGKLYGLRVTSIIDERFDPYKATDAACRHLKDLYAMFGDWSLVMAAYNSGAGNVKKAIRRAGGVENYWAIWPYLPRETRGYVPAFIAVVYVMNHAQEHNLYPLHPGILYNGIDTVMVKQPLAFDQISEFLSVPLEDVTFLNPMFKAGIIPAYDGKEYSLRLPNEYIDKFIDGEVALYNSKSKSGMDKEKVLAEAKKASERSVHVVRSGESLGLIAKKNHVTVAQLKQWNNLRSNTIYPGQRLTIYPSPQYANAPPTTATYSKAEPSGQTGSGKAETASSENDQKPAANGDAPKTLVPTYHYVKSGENLALIAKKYGCSVEDIRAWNNIKGNTIYPKQKLKVGEKQEAGPAQKTAEVNGPGEIKYVYHTVKKGDTLWGISQQYKGVSVEEIRKLNDMGSSSRLQVGQKLKIAIDG